MEIRYQMKETQLMKMENEIKNLRNKCAILEEQNKQMVESREKIFKTLKEQKNSLIFPPPERIPVEKLFEGYSKLYEAFNKISNDKEVAIVSLQNEILINDQQRNYIEILKQTLESNLVKNGIKSQIDLYNKIQKKIKSEDCINNLDSMSDYYEELFNVVGLNQKIEDLYKQNNTLELENNKLKSDINDINSKNEVFREQINNSLKSGIKELDQAKYKIKDLEQQKKELINENKNLQEYIDKIKIQQKENENFFFIINCLFFFFCIYNRFNRQISFSHNFIVSKTSLSNIIYRIFIFCAFNELYFNISRVLYPKINFAGIFRNNSLLFIYYFWYYINL